MIVRMMVLAWMVAGLVAGSVKAKSPQTSSNPAATSKESHRSLSAIRADVRIALTAEAKTRRSGDNPREVLRLIELYREMATHPQHDTSDVLKELGQQVRLRLVSVRDRIDRKASAAERSSKKEKVSRVAAVPETHVLAQQLAPPAAGGPRQAAGQGAVVTGIPRANATVTDYGPELVELIEATISPDTWNINGGNGAIVYYAPLHVLVVSAPDEIHAQIGDVLGQLNAAQRRQDGAQVVVEARAVHARD